MKKLDAEESEILAAFDAGTLKSVANATAEIKRHREAAVATFAKDSRINIRISSKDLRALQKKALGEFALPNVDCECASQVHRGTVTGGTLSREQRVSK